MLKEAEVLEEEMLEALEVKVHELDDRTVKEAELVKTMDADGDGVVSGHEVEQHVSQLQQAVSQGQARIADLEQQLGAARCKEEENTAELLHSLKGIILSRLLDTTLEALQANRILDSADGAEPKVQAQTVSSHTREALMPGDTNIEYVIWLSLLFGSNQSSCC